MESARHWENVFATRPANEVSWFQEYPYTSMQLVTGAGVDRNAQIIDIGGGDSRLADALLEEGFTGVSVLDISSNALVRARQRLGEKAAQVNWIHSDVTAYATAGTIDLWHDRAAFHFLSTSDQVDRYARNAAGAVKPGGWLVAGTFSTDGPKKCSGLEVKQYDEEGLTAAFRDAFIPVRCFREDHTTPAGAVQNFQFCVFRRKE